MADNSRSKSKFREKDGRGADALSLDGVGHQGLVTERDIDAEFGLFTEGEKASKTEE